MHKPHTSFIYFDIGGVVVRDFSQTNKWQELLQSIGIRSEHEEAFLQFFKEKENLAFTGKNIESILPQITAKFGLRFSAGFSLLREFIKRFEKNETILPVLESIPRNVRRGLMTNMYPGMLNAILSGNLMPQIIWDITIDSSEEKLRKPQKELFVLAQKKAMTEPENILLVDNNPINIAAADDMGWQTFFYDSSDYARSSQILQQKISTFT